MPEEIKKYPSGKKGICSNCGREKFIADKNGHCGTCSSVVKGMDTGSAAYAAALATIKDHIGAPGFKKHPVRHKKPDPTPVRKPNPKEVARTGLPKIIQIMRDEQAYYLAEANKLEKAINLLESL